jgi:hypothetical protein
MPVRRRRLSSFALPALVALAACSTDSIVGPAPAVEAESAALAGEFDRTMARLAASPELSSLASPTAQQLVAEAASMIRGAAGGGGTAGLMGSAGGWDRFGPQFVMPPANPNATPGDVIHVLFSVTLLLYKGQYFADATGDPRPDRPIAIIHPVHYAAEGIVSGDRDQIVAGLEAAIEWLEQRNSEGMIPGDITTWLIDYANIGIAKSGGSNTTVTMCLSSARRSCVTAALNSIRWDRQALKTRLAQTVSYTFLDGTPARVELRFRLATGAPNCVILGSPIATSSDTIWTTLVRLQPTLTANPVDRTTSFECLPHGIIRGFRWDGFVVRDAGGAILASCSRSAGNPCFES